MISFGLSLTLLILTCFVRFAFDEQIQPFLFAAILGLPILEILRQGKLTNLGAFLLLSFVMYGIRPLYIVIEDDRSLIYELMGRVDISPVLSRAMFLAVIALLTICVGHAFAKIQWPLKYSMPLPGVPLGFYFPRPSNLCTLFLLGFQVICLIFLFGLRARGLAVYASDAGAYTYLFPQVLQASQILPLVAFSYNRNKNPPLGQFSFFFSLTLFVLFTFFMKDLSMFRGFYLTGALCALIAVLHSLRGRVAYWVLVLPILYLLPAFRALGESRLLGADQAFSYALEVIKSFSFEKWWDFFNPNGDMNVFDTLVAAVHSTPRFQPYIWAWFYPLFHFIPRAWWPSKPDRGMLVDMSFAQGNPFHPGLIGFYYLDGGLFWMLLSCFMTGVILYSLERWLSAMRPGYLRSSLFGIVVINSLYSARGYFHFSVIQYVFMIVPVVLLSWIIDKLGFMKTPRLQQL